VEQVANALVVIANKHIVRFIAGRFKNKN